MAPTYLKIQPSLPVTSIPDAVKYYTECLGFRVAGRDGDNHCWIQLVDEELEKDDVSKWDVAVNIYLRSKFFSPIRNRNSPPLSLSENSSLLLPTWACAFIETAASLERGFAGPRVPPMIDDVKFSKVYIHIDGEDDELERLAETLKARGVKVVEEVETKPWGVKELLIEDPDEVSNVMR